MARFKRLLIVTFFIVVCFFVLFFCLRNSAVVDVDLLFIHWKSAPVESVIVASFILGGFAGLLSALALLLGMRKKYRLALRQLKALQLAQSAPQ